uniref:Uncharacterized protein n=1 Tax=Oryza sativa subsp. japonica TaxID=39947 RepID=Q654M5_ORYSJ|nr:hypothetical protein [Oryza sativa Japonica Group]BAD45747.1 hypothetical protein [Oryza sativa Japonica Group]
MTEEAAARAAGRRKGTGPTGGPHLSVTRPLSSVGELRPWAGLAKACALQGEKWGKIQRGPYPGRTEPLKGGVPFRSAAASGFCGACDRGLPSRTDAPR